MCCYAMVINDTGSAASNGASELCVRTFHPHFPLEGGTSGVFSKLFFWFYRQIKRRQLKMISAADKETRVDIRSSFDVGRCAHVFHLPLVFFFHLFFRIKL